MIPKGELSRYWTSLASERGWCGCSLGLSPFIELGVLIRRIVGFSYLKFVV